MRTKTAVLILLSLFLLAEGERLSREFVPTKSNR
jgi:hypothetical protein